MGTRSLPMTIVYGEEDRDDFTDWLSNHLDRKVKKYGYVQAHWTSGGGHTESLAYFVGKDVYVPSDQGKKHIVEATQRDMQEIQDSLLLPLVDELAKVSV